MSTTIISAPQDATGRWLARFRDKPSEALDGALTGRAHLGACNTLPPSVALGQFLVHPEQTLDGVLLRWLEVRWGKIEMPGLRTRRYAEALAEALRAVDLLGLSECQRWVRQRAPSDYRWLPCSRPWPRSSRIGRSSPSGCGCPVSKARPRWHMVAWPWPACACCRPPIPAARPWRRPCSAGPGRAGCGRRGCAGSAGGPAPRRSESGR